MAYYLWLVGGLWFLLLAVCVVGFGGWYVMLWLCCFKLMLVECVCMPMFIQDVLFCSLGGVLV